MAISTQYQKAKKALKTRGLMWVTENIPLNHKDFSADGIFNPETDECSTAIEVLEDSTRAPVPKDLYDSTAEFMRTDPYDEATREVVFASKGVVWRIAHGRVYTNRSSQYVVLSGKRKILSQVSYDYQDVVAERKADEIQLSASYFPKPIKKSGRVVTMILGGGPSNNIYHWMVDGLPRLELVSRLGLLDDVDEIVVQCKGYPDWLETLELMGVERQKITVVDQQLIHIEAEELIALSHPRGRLSNVTPRWVIDFHRERFLPQIPEKSSAWPEKIYVSRKDSSLRGVLNEEELSEFLRQRGYVEIVLTQLSYAEKVGHFHHAREIVSMSGAGFAFLMYCQKNARVVELFPAGFVHYANCAIATQVGMDYRYLVFGELDTGKSGYSAQRQTLTVDLPQLAAELER